VTEAERRAERIPAVPFERKVHEVAKNFDPLLER
jgi:hypothetical protein